MQKSKIVETKPKYKLSIIIPHYKEPDAVVDLALSSIKIQAGVDFSKIQIVIVNDHSDVELRHYKNVKYLRRPTNGGCGMARQYGIDHTNSEYFMFIDADDVLFSTTSLFCLFEAMKKEPDIIFGNFIEQSSDGTLTPHVFHNTWCHGKVYKRSYIKSIGLKFEKGIMLSEDACFNIQALNRTKNIFRLEENIILWKFNPSSLTRKDGGTNRRNAYYFLEGQFIATRNLRDVEICPELVVNNCVYMYLTMQSQFWKGDLELKKQVEKRIIEYRKEFEDMYINIQDTHFNKIFNSRFIEHSKDVYWKPIETYDQFYERIEKENYVKIK